MKVAFQLHRLPTVEPTSPDALLLPTLTPAELLSLLAALGHDPIPRLHLVEGGFLLIASQTIRNIPVGAVALRRLGRHLYLPTDALLSPSLLEDEAAGLTRERGLMFLPGGRVLEFEPTTPLPLSAVLTVGEIRRSDWRPFPTRSALADRLREVLLDRPEDTAVAVIERGDEGVGEASPAQGEGVGSWTARSVGRWLTNLGAALGLKGLERFGAFLAERMPRLPWDLLRRQETALRDLLREFREGDPERALRRALPLNAPESRGDQVARSDQLPPQNLNYSPERLIGSGRGPKSAWLGGAELQNELIWEYRKAAQLAAQQGDYRRAAMIYARLLHDFRSAAATLERGGLFHDAALLYLEKVGDARAAARAFASAGEIDRAVQLYRRERCFAESGDLLKQAGEDDEALHDYRRAAEELLQQRWQSDRSSALLRAGELLLNRAGRPDLASDYFRRAWALRPDANATACGLHLARLYAVSEPQALLTLMREANALFLTWGADSVAAEFYNTVAQLAELETLAVVREEVRDVALLGLAGRLRRAADKSGGLGAVSALLGSSAVWPAAVVSDARYAVQRLAQSVRSEKRSGSPTQVQLANGTVTAACHCAWTGDVFVGLKEGEVVWFQPTDGRVTPLNQRQGSGSVRALTASPDGVSVVACHVETELEWSLVHRVRVEVGRYDLAGTELGANRAKPIWLTPTLMDDDGKSLFAVCDGQILDLYGSDLRFWERLRLPVEPTEVIAALLLPVNLSPEPIASPVLTMSASPLSSEPPLFLMLLFADDTLWLQKTARYRWRRVALQWSPAARQDGVSRSISLSWQMRDVDHLELLGLNAQGALCWSLLLFGSGTLQNLSTRISWEAGYRAAVLVRTGLVAAVAVGRVDWMLTTDRGFSRWISTELPASEAIACYANHETRELLIVCADGRLFRVPLPS